MNNNVYDEPISTNVGDTIKAIFINFQRADIKRPNADEVLILKTPSIEIPWPEGMDLEQAIYAWGERMF